MHGKCGKGWFKFVVMAVAGIAVAGLVVMLLWNWLVPQLFGGSEIQFLQALGLMVLMRLLVGGFHRAGFHSHMRRHMEERWKEMTAEEREKFRAGLHRCWGHKKTVEASGEE